MFMTLLIDNNKNIDMIFLLLWMFRFDYSLSVEKSPNNPMLGRREIVDGKVSNHQLNYQP